METFELKAYEVIPKLEGETNFAEWEDALELYLLLKDRKTSREIIQAWIHNVPELFKEVKRLYSVLLVEIHWEHILGKTIDFDVMSVVRVSAISISGCATLL